MKDTKKDSKANDKELSPFEGIIVLGVAFLIGRKLFNSISQDREEDEKPTSQYNTELEALRRLFREGLL